MGFNEAAGYGAVALTALASGALADAYGLRPAPFLLGLAFVALGLGLSTFAVRETRDPDHHADADHARRSAVVPEARDTPAVFGLTSFRVKTPSLRSAS